MTEALYSPPFGQADLTNCERELIHLAGAIQSHGALLVLRETDLVVLQASENPAWLIGAQTADLLGNPVGVLGGDIQARIRELAGSFTDEVLAPFRCSVELSGELRDLEATGHRYRAGAIIVELEPADRPEAFGSRLQKQLSAAVHRFSKALSIPTLSDAVVQCYRDLTGYDRVMVYKFDPDGHGEIIAEARDGRLETLLGHRYPATDIPQRARELYIRNRVRVLADVDSVPVPVVPRHFPLTGEELDMSMCHLRSMSPLHLQYLKNMGVTATLVVSLVREGKLWGLIACHHYSPREARYSVRAAADLLAEVVVTRITAIENYVHTQVDVLVRRLELRLIEATSSEGDWRHALFRNPRSLLQPVNASGAALLHDGEILTAGEVPSTHEIRALAKWVHGQIIDTLFSCASVSQANPGLASLTPTASGVLAVELSSSRDDMLLWFRKEQIRNVQWAGDPSKPMVDNDPLTLSPRRSFAVWSEIVRGTAAPWSRSDLALSRAIGASLRDVIVQIQAVRLLISHHQLSQFRQTVEDSSEPVIAADAEGRILFSNTAFVRLLRQHQVFPAHLDDMAAHFYDPPQVQTILRLLRVDREPWRGELSLALGDGAALPVGVRADIVPGPNGSVLGFIVILTDLTDSKRTEAARRHLEESLSQASRPDARMLGRREPDEVIGAISANASVAAMELTDTAIGHSLAPLIEEVEGSAKRAVQLYEQLRAYGRGR